MRYRKVLANAVVVETRIPRALAVGNAKLNPTTILSPFEFPQNQGEIYGGFGGAKMSYGKYICGQSAKTNLSLEAIMLPNQKEILRIEVED